MTRRKTGLGVVFWQLVAYKVVFFALMWMAISILPNNFDVYSFFGNFHRTELVPEGFRKYFETWDAQFYLMLADDGYASSIQKSPMAAAFFPLWPLLVALSSFLVAGNTLIASLILANVFSIAAFYLLYKFLRGTENEQVALYTLLLMLAFPGAIFFSLPYTESLFLLLTVVTWTAFHKMRSGGSAFIATGFSSYLAAVSRPTGVLLAVPMAVEFVSQKRWKMLPLVALPVAGFLTYLALLHYVTGGSGAMAEAQSKFIAQSSPAKLLQVREFVTALMTPKEWHGFFDSRLDRLWFAWFLGTLPFLWKKDKSMFAFALVMGLVPAMTVSFMAFTRYFAVIFPCFIATAMFFDSPTRKNWMPHVLALLFGIQLFFLIRHINMIWAA